MFRSSDGTIKKCPHFRDFIRDNIDVASMFRIVHIILLLLPLAACPGSREQAKDSGGAPAEGGSFTDGAATRLLCDNDCTDLVVDRILLPTSTAEANKYGLVLGGKTYNGLGTIISLVNQYASTSGLQDDVDGAVYKGDTLVLLKLQASDLVNASQVKAQAWGGSASCCVAGKDLAACKTEARSRCFNGTSVIQKAAGSPENMIFSGAITAGVASLSSSTMKLEIKLNLSSTLKLTLKHARLTGKVTAAGITDGVLAGAIPRSDLQTTLVPELAKLLDGVYKDTTTDQKTKDLIKQLADTNGDGTISTSEVAQNGLLSSVLAGDVDVDQDGEKELSLGLGLSAVPCIISEFKGF